MNLKPSKNAIAKIVHPMHRRNRPGQGRKPMYTEPMPSIRLYLPAAVLDVLSSSAQAAGVSRAVYIRRLVALGYQALHEQQTGE